MVAFESYATNLTLAAGVDGDAFEDVFTLAVENLLNTAFRPAHVSLPFTGNKAHIDGHSYSPMPAPSMIGFNTVFASEAKSLVDENQNGLRDDDTNNKADVFVHDPEPPTWIRRYSVQSDRDQATGGQSVNPDITGLLAFGRVVVYESLATNLDPADTNGLWDIYETWSPQGAFIRGDVNKDGCVNTDDFNFLDSWLFQGGAAAACIDSGDANDDGKVNLTDYIRLNSFIVSDCMSSPPLFPFPGCGHDQTGDGLTCADRGLQLCEQICSCF